MMPADGSDGPPTQSDFWHDYIHKSLSHLTPGGLRGFVLKLGIKLWHTIHRMILSSIPVFLAETAIALGDYSRPVRWQPQLSHNDQRCRLLLALRCTGIVTRPLNENSYGLIAEHRSLETTMYSILRLALCHDESTAKDERAAHVYPGDA
ncbi:hypothetical protein BFJ63_vAg15387 [Fusarium oxysporum f. sp. narcissi]|uniref:Uncharacterized protein n=2 Tax=Fusarium oxysporum TaxID=5507 RepID=A0A4Q2V3Y4_FUSOX|nr:hypothetical protein BFJ70_g11586 [Fusarium oxysporum]RYC81721.1 hypothetical protein BFJ63_vAg15387 [Fusarium oxysporum f. sp. narcissi]